MNKYSTLLLFILLSFNVFGQSIQGRVKDNNEAPLPFANVLLLNAKDSSLIKGAVSDTLGVYIIDNIQPGAYLLSVSMIGYKQAYLPAKVATQDRQMDLGTIILVDDITQLGEVSVTEKRPFVEQQWTGWW